MFADLNDDNFVLYAAKAYDKPHIIQSEFEEDLKRIKYVKRLIRKYKQTGEFKERLILNHVIILSNVFGVEPTVNMLFLRCDPEDRPVLKTLLMYLNYMPDNFRLTFNKVQLIQKEIPVDLHIAFKLRTI